MNQFERENARKRAKKHGSLSTDGCGGFNESNGAKSHIAYWRHPDHGVDP